MVQWKPKKHLAPKKKENGEEKKLWNVWCEHWTDCMLRDMKFDGHAIMLEPNI